MRRFIRFMCEEELEKYLRGDKLENNTIHEGRIKGSFGFCFFDSTDLDPITAHHVLSGIASLEYMVEFMVDDEVAERVLTKSKGLYHMPDTPLTEGKALTEYCTKSYNREEFAPYQIWHLVVSYPRFLANERMGK